MNSMNDAAKKKSAAQSARFIETAKKVGVDESGRKFAQVFKKIVPQKRGAKT